MKKVFFKKIKTRAGMSLVELVVSIAVASIIFTTVTWFTIYLKTMTVNFEKKQAVNIDSELVYRFLEKDILNSFFSFNNLTLPGETTNKFFDYYPDYVPSSQISLSPPIQRQFGLKGDGSNEFSMLVMSDPPGAPLSYDPVKAYAYPSSSGSLTTPLTLTFANINQNNYISSQRPNFLTGTKYLLFYVPVWLRKKVVQTLPDGHQITTSNPVDFPKMPVFLGKNSESNFNKYTWNSTVSLVNPSDGVEYTDIDAYLRNLPVVGGGAPVVMLRVLSLVKYKIVSTTVGGKTRYQIYRWNSDSHKEGDLGDFIGEGVKGITFQRKLLTLPLMDIVLDVDKE